MGTPALGWSCAVAAAFAFSVQYVPVKKYEVYDGITFQWFLCHGVLFTAFTITLITGDIYLPLDNLPLLAGLMWGLSNFLCVPLIQLLGMGIGFSLYHFMNIMCGYCIGRFGLLGIPQSGGLVSDIGCGIVFLSFVLVTFVETGHSQEEANSYLGFFSVLDHADSVGTPHLHDEERCPGTRVVPPESCGCRKVGLKALGIVIAVVCGVLTGTCAAPATMYNLKHPGRPTAAVFPMCLGVWAVSTVIYLAYAGCAHLQGLPVRHAAIRPAFISGALWSIGNACNLLGVTQISYTLCYSTGIIGCLFLAGIYSLIIFREIQETRQIVIFCVGLGCQAIGVALIAGASRGVA